MKLPTIPRVERAVGRPARTWKGRCHEVAQKMIAHGLVRGHVIEGLWLGGVAPRSYFVRRGCAGTPVIQHVWIRLRGGHVLDPTRWVFEGRAPYLHVGKPGPEYDAEGRALRGKAPPPLRATEEKYKIKLLSPAAWQRVKRLLRRPRQRRLMIGYSQALWLGRLPAKKFGRHADDVRSGLRIMGVKVA